MIHPIRNRFLAALAALSAIALAGCQARSESASAEATAKPAAAPKSAASPNEDSVEVDPAMAANVKVEPVREEALPRVLTATGKIQFNEDQAARVLAPMPGQVLDLKPRVGRRRSKRTASCSTSKAAKLPAWSPTSCRRSASRPSPRSPTS